MNRSLVFPCESFHGVCPALVKQLLSHLILSNMNLMKNDRSTKRGGRLFEKDNESISHPVSVKLCH